MKLCVLANLYGAKPLDEALKIISGLGVHTVEIGAGGYPGKAHLDPKEYLGNPEKIEALKESPKWTNANYAMQTFCGISAVMMP